MLFAYLSTSSGLRYAAQPRFMTAEIFLGRLLITVRIFECQCSSMAVPKSINFNFSFSRSSEDPLEEFSVRLGSLKYTKLSGFKSK